MPSLRESIKRALPSTLRQALVDARQKLGPPAIERIHLHDYEALPDPAPRPRLSLVIPTVSPRKAFGGITTGIDIYLQIGKRMGADLRIILDDFERDGDTSVVDACARSAGVASDSIEIVRRTHDVPRIGVRSNEAFFAFSWWTALNVRSLLEGQQRIFGGDRRPYIFLIQEYEPHFYPFSSTHMMARLALDTDWPYWGIFNSSELYAYFLTQGHRVERAFVFEPRISSSLRPFLAGEAPTKVRRILVYGRPSIPRNGYPAIELGLRKWAELYPEFSGWEVVSAGLPHAPVPLAANRAMTSLGKLSLADYGQLLRTTGVGLSLMVSPHPSYPPLEMAHFGVRTVTNSYLSKDLSSSHPNIRSIRNVAPETIAHALADACREFEAAPAAGWLAQTQRPSFLEAGPFGFLDEVADGLMLELSRVPA